MRSSHAAPPPQAYRSAAADLHRQLEFNGPEGAIPLSLLMPTGEAGGGPGKARELRRSFNASPAGPKAAGRPTPPASPAAKLTPPGGAFGGSKGPALSGSWGKASPTPLKPVSSAAALKAITGARPAAAASPAAAAAPYADAQE